MASEKITALIEEVKALTVLELSELVHALEDEFGVSAAAPAAAAAGDDDNAAHPAEGLGDVIVLVEARKAVTEDYTGAGAVISAVRCHHIGAEKRAFNRNMNTGVICKGNSGGWNHIAEQTVRK